MNEANEMSQDGKVNVKIPLACHFSLMNEFMTAVEKPSKFFFVFLPFNFSNCMIDEFYVDVTRGTEIYGG